MMIDGRIAILTEKPKHIPEPVELTTHPLRDVWLLRRGKWDRTEEAVAWEDLVASTYPIRSGVDACLCIYRKSSSDLRRHAEAEATLQRESYALRHATDDYHYSPKGPECDSSLIMSAPHSIQPVVLEDNQATIRIMESGKSPAFRHADKTQRINLGWLSEQFRRKHYVLAYISTTLKAADILTKPFTNADKWRHAVRLLGHGVVKPDSRSSASPSTAAPTSDSRPRTEPEVKRVIIEICGSEDSLLGGVDGPHGSDCHVVRVTERLDLNSYRTRRDLLEVAKGYAKRGVPILVWVSLPCAGGSTWTFVNLTIPQNAPKVYEEKRKFLKLWSSFVNLSTGLDCCHVHYALEWPRGCTYWDMKRVQKWLDNHKCVKVNFDGCRLGLVNHEGIPVKKPWTIATMMSHLMQQLDGLRCTGGHPHAKCTKDSENYTIRGWSI